MKMFSKNTVKKLASLLLATTVVVSLATSELYTTADAIGTSANYTWDNNNSYIIYDDVSIPGEVMAVGIDASLGGGTLPVSPGKTFVLYDKVKTPTVKTITSIGAYAYDDAVNHANLGWGATPAYVTGLNKCTFSYSTGLHLIGLDAFTGTGITAFDIPYTVDTLNFPIDRSTAFTSYTTNVSGRAASAADANAYINGQSNKLTPFTSTQIKSSTYIAANSVLFNNDGTGNPGTSLLSVPSGFSGTSGTYTVPTGITTIGPEAFAGCVNLTKIILPTSVNSISDNAFDGCTNLTSITILDGPQAATDIGANIFNGCSQTITISGTIPSYIYSKWLAANPVGSAAMGSAFGDPNVQFALISGTIDVTNVSPAATANAKVTWNATPANSVINGNTLNYIDPNTTVMLTAPTAATGYIFSGWQATGADSVTALGSSAASTTITLNMPSPPVSIVLTPTYAAKLIVKSSPAGTSIAVSDTSSTDYSSVATTGTPVKSGVSVHLLAPATSGTLVFTGWSGVYADMQNFKAGYSATMADTYIVMPSSGVTLTANYLDTSVAANGYKLTAKTNLASPSDKLATTLDNTTKTNLLPSLSTGTTVTTGDSVSLTAAPISGYTFIGWSGSGLSALASGSKKSNLAINVVMPASNTSLVANYISTAGSFSLTATTKTGVSAIDNASQNFVSGNDVTTPSNALIGLNIGATVASGDSVWLNAATITGYSFTGWSGDTAAITSGSATETSIKVSVTANTALQAHYIIDPNATTTYLAVVTSVGNPIKSVVDNNDATNLFPNIDSGAPVTIGHNVTIVAPVITGYLFSGWYATNGDATSKAAISAGTADNALQSITTTISGSTNITAQYVSINSPKLTVTSTGASGIDFSPLDSTSPNLFANLSTGAYVTAGDVITVTAPKTSGLYTFVGWSGDLACVTDSTTHATGLAAAGDATLTLTMPDGPTKLVANYVLSSGLYTLSVTTNPAGSFVSNALDTTTPANLLVGLSTTGATSVSSGDVLSMTAPTISGLIFVGWSGNIAAITSAGGQTTKAIKVTVTAATTLVANYVSTSADSTIAATAATTDAAAPATFATDNPVTGSVSAPHGYNALNFLLSGAYVDGGDTVSLTAPVISGSVFSAGRAVLLALKAVTPLTHKAN